MTAQDGDCLYSCINLATGIAGDDAKRIRYFLFDYLQRERGWLDFLSGTSTDQDIREVQMWVYLYRLLDDEFGDNIEIQSLATMLNTTIELYDNHNRGEEVVISRHTPGDKPRNLERFSPIVASIIHEHSLRKHNKPIRIMRVTLQNKPNEGQPHFNLLIRKDLEDRRDKYRYEDSENSEDF